MANPLNFQSQRHYPDRLPTFTLPLIGLTLALMVVETLAGCSSISLIVTVIFALGVILPLPSTLVALVAGFIAPLLLARLPNISLIVNAHELQTLQLITLSCIGICAVLVRNFLRWIEWSLASQSILLNLIDTDKNTNPQAVVTHALTALRELACADVAIALRQLDEVTAEASVCIPEKVLPERFIDPSIYAEALAQNRCLYYIDYPADPDAARVLLAKGTKTLAVLPLSSADGLQGAILLIWYRRYNISPHLKNFIELLIGELRTLLRFQATTLRLDKIQARFGAMLETIPQGVVFVDESGEQGWVNQAAATKLGLASGAVEPQAIAQAMTNLRMSADNQESISLQAAQFFSKPNTEIRNWYWIFSQPQPLVLNISSTPTRVRELPGRLWVFDDITGQYFSRISLVERTEQLIQANEKLEQVALEQTYLYEKLTVANQELQRLANLDGLTQVANRRNFDQSFEQEWYRLKREQLPLSLILMDVDYFKVYNDTYGHLAGDFCLQDVAKTIRNSIKRPADLVARYGGEEFIVMLPNTPMEGALEVAEIIRANIKGLKILHTGSKVNQYVTLSLGVASIIPNSGATPESLIIEADTALYQAKNQGRDRVVAAITKSSTSLPDCECKTSQVYPKHYNNYPNI